MNPYLWRSGQKLVKNELSKKAEKKYGNLFRNTPDELQVSRTLPETHFLLLFFLSENTKTIRFLALVEEIRSI